jgi:hypothetical protein
MMPGFLNLLAGVLLDNKRCLRRRWYDGEFDYESVDDYVIVEAVMIPRKIWNDEPDYYFPVW